MNRWLLLATLQSALVVGCQTVPRQPIPATPTVAVDLAGVRHSASEYPKGHVPWVQDLVHTVGPDYPFGERALRHEGAGIFRLALDERSGRVVTVSVLRSTGFKPLDLSAVVALSQWRWKPGRWKQIDMPVRFTIGSPPREGTPLPHS